MKKSASEVSAILNDRIKEIAPNENRCATICDNANQKFNVKPGDVMDYFTGRKKTEEAGLFDLFILCWGIDSVDPSSHLVDDVFTDMETRELNLTKADDHKVKFPIRIKVIPVGDNHWIGGTDVQFFMRLREAQIINYNTNTQRTMRKVIRHGEETFKIMINKKAVREIKQSFLDGTYKPNPLTLNIPLSEEEFWYDDRRGELVINKLRFFDILDGYHRYIAMSEIWDGNHDFNYNMEIRILHVSDAEAQQFIYQEAQHTEMPKIDTESMNMGSPEVLVTERLNADPLFYFTQQISRNEGVINYGEFSRCVRFFYFKGNKEGKVKTAAKVNNTKIELRDKLNEVFSMGKPKEHYDFCDLMIIFTGIEYKNDSHLIYKALCRSDQINKRPYSNKTPRRGLVTELEKFITQEEGV